MIARHEWIFDGAITCNGSRNPGPVQVFHGSAETWFSTQGFFRQSLSLNCVDRRLIMGDAGEGPGAAPRDAHDIQPSGRGDHVGYHVLTCGHPADDERVIRDIPSVHAAASYARDSLVLSIDALTHDGVLSRADNFSEDQSPWRIHIELVVARADVREFLRLSEQDAARFEQRFSPA